MKKYNIECLKSGLTNAALLFCKHIFPNGKLQNGEYAVGSLCGEPGNSLKIRVSGPKSGIWQDFATGERGNNLLELLCRVRTVDFITVCEEATDWLSNNDCCRFYYPPTPSEPHVSKHELPALKTHDFPDLKFGRMNDYAKLSSLMGVSMDGLILAGNDGILKFFNHKVNGRCWSVVDKWNRVRQDRRRECIPFILSDWSLTKSRTIGSPTCPIGLPTEKQIICLVEGSSDLLAAYSLIHTESLDDKIAPVTILGASNRIHEDILEDFRGKYVLGFPDYDSAGITGMTRWSKQLSGIVSEFEIFDHNGLFQDDGKKVKDLRDFLRIDVAQWEDDHDVRFPFSSFISKLLMEGKLYVTD